MVIATHAHVLIVDDHPLFCDGVRSMLARRAPHLECTAAGDADQALALLSRSPTVDLVIADQRLTGALDGLALLTRVGHLYPTVGRMLVSGSDDPVLVTQARKLGVLGFLPKSLEPEAWVDALGRVLDGQTWFPLPDARPLDAPAAPSNALTARQATILERIALGQTNKLIARELGITERTIKYHLAVIFARVRAGSRAEAVARAGAQGWIRLPEHAPEPAPDTAR